MRPIAVLIAIVFGSAAAISFGLIGTTVVFLFLQGEHAQLAREMRPLLISCALFVGLAGSAAAALYSTLKGLIWRKYAQGLTSVAIVGIAIFYWPRP